MEEIFQAIRQHKISDQIVEQIKSLISDGKLKAGEKLPNERDFSLFLGVGRSSLREAIATLEATGFVEVRKRKGVYVRSLSARIIYDPLRLLLQEDQGKIRSLYELRRDIETAASYRAAQVRSPAGLKHLEELLARLQDSAESLSLILDYDFQFHLAVATLADNFLGLACSRTSWNCTRTAWGWPTRTWAGIRPTGTFSTPSTGRSSKPSAIRTRSGPGRPCSAT